MRNIAKKTAINLLIALNCLFAFNAVATDFSTTGEITGAQSTSLIQKPGAGNGIAFGTGYNNSTYQGFYTQSQLEPFYTPNVIQAPSGFYNASALTPSDYATLPYNVYNITIKGSGVYSFQVTDPSRPSNWVGLTSKDLMAALYVRTGSGTAFVPGSPLVNLVAVSDDIKNSSSANPYPMFYQNQSATDCMTLSLVYFPWDGATGTVRITASGPGQIATTCSALGPSSSNTLAAVQQNASALSGIYNVQAAALQAGLTYDCNTFDKYGLCASIGGRATYGLTAPSGNQQAGLVVVSHKPDSHFRYGGFADQSVATASPNGIKYNNSGPMFGFFGYWNHQKDNMGWGASVTTAFSNSNLTVTRNASLANTEAGSGNTEMQGQAVQAQATYAMQATTRIKAQPYLGLRYYRVATGGYSEGSNADVTSPLTYNAMAQEVFAAVGGLGTSVFLAEKLTGNASVGIQQNLNYKMGNYQGTSSISGLESFSVSMPSNINSMATATAGVTYAIKKNEKLSLNALWQQQAFSATNTITALATYSIGF